MRQRIGFAVLVVLAFFLALTANAQVNVPASGSEGMLDQLRQQGWHDVAPGVLQRQLPGQAVETLAWGPDGLARAVQELRHRYATLLETSEKNPSAELEKALGQLQEQMAELQKAIAAQESGRAAPQLPACDFAFGCGANATWLTNVQGVTASSSAYFYNNCYETGHVYAEARGSTNSGFDFQSRWLDGSNVSVSASVSVPGGPSCYSDAYSYVYAVNGSIYYSCYQYNGNCPVPPDPPVASLYGSSHLYVYGYECVTEYWSASASGGTPPYSFSWNTSYGSGSGSSFSITFCGGGSTYNESVYVSVTVTDAAGQTDSESMTTTVHYQGNDGCELYRPWCEP